MYGVLFARLFENQEVKGHDYCQNLKELMDICMLCNDSGLDYNEVHSTVFYSTCMWRELVMMMCDSE